MINNVSSSLTKTKRNFKAVRRSDQKLGKIQVYKTYLKKRTEKNSMLILQTREETGCF